MENKKEKENIPNVPDTIISYVIGRPLATIRAYKYGHRDDKVGFESTKCEIQEMLVKLRAKKMNELDQVNN